MTTWTIVGLIDEKTTELHVVAVFENAQMNADKNVDVEIGRKTLECFVGYFVADDAEAAAELARKFISEPEETKLPYTSGKLRKHVEDPQIRGNLL
jgi:hypothetical protein